MSEELHGQNTELAISPQLVPGTSSSRLVKRGLDNIERERMTAEEIGIARRENNFLKGLSDEAVKLAVKRPTSWEYRLFFQTLIDEVAGYETLRQARSLGFMPGATENIPLEQTYVWVQARLAEMSQLLYPFETLIENDLPIAFGVPGEPGDVEAIILISRKLGLIYKQYLEISIRCQRVRRTIIFDSVFREMSKLTNNILKEFEDFPPFAMSSLMEAIASPSGSEKRVLQLAMSVSMDSGPLLAEMKKASFLLGI